MREVRGRGVYSDEMETELSAIKQSSLSGGNWAQLITRLIAPLPRSMVVAVSCCGGAFWTEGTGRLSRMEGTTNGTKWTNFLRELASESAKNHRPAATTNVLTAKSVLEFLQNRVCHWKFGIMIWAVTELQLPTGNWENSKPLIVLVLEYLVRTQCSCKLNVFIPVGLSVGCSAHHLMDWYEILYDIHGPQSLKPTDFGSRYFSSRATMRLSFFFGFILDRLPWHLIHIHGAQTMIPIDFSDPLTFPVVLPAGQDFNYPVKHRHLLDGSVLNMVHLFLVPEGGGYWFLWYIYFSSSAIMRLTFLVFRDISQQPLDELPTNFHGSKSMQPNDVGDPPTFPQTPPADWIQTEMSQQVLNWFYNVVHNIVVFVCFGDSQICLPYSRPKFQFVIFFGWYLQLAFHCNTQPHRGTTSDLDSVSCLCTETRGMKDPDADTAEW